MQHRISDYKSLPARKIDKPRKLFLVVGRPLPHGYRANIVIGKV